MAHRLARYIYAMVTQGVAYLTRTLDDLDARRRERQKTHLAKLADELGYALVPQ